MKTILNIFAVVFAAAILAGCCTKVNEGPYTNVEHADWTADAVLYEVNVRQYTPEGTFAAFDAHLPRLKELGIDILWFMPIHPIGEVERKGELGSYYSVKDYKGVNPEFGTIEDFKNTVAKAHELGMKVIIDWVANHTSRDHEWIAAHPDWYVMDPETGTPVAPFDWTDVAELNYDNADMRAAMYDALRYWIDEIGIDGYRCDVAHEVPVDFWNDAWARIRADYDNLFFLAETEDAALIVDAFDAYYGWDNHHKMTALAQGKMNAAEYVEFLNAHAERFPFGAIAMNFTTNHDENSWNGTEFEKFGDAARQMAALTFCEPGMPLIYNGQEVGNTDRLEFFYRDPIVWEDKEGFTEFYKGLIAMRDAHPSMYAPAAGAPMVIVENNQPEKVFSFSRSLGNGSDGFLAVFNFSAEEVLVNVEGEEYDLGPWGYEIVFNE